MNDLTNIYTDRREVETDKVVTHVPQWPWPVVAFLWWAANKVLVVWLFVLVRRLLKRPTPALPEREGDLLAGTVQSDL